MCFRNGGYVLLTDGVIYRIAYSPCFPSTYLYVWYEASLFGKKFIKIKKIRIKDIVNYGTSNLCSIRALV